jgi:hypothetical protein
MALIKRKQRDRPSWRYDGRKPPRVEEAKDVDIKGREAEPSTRESLPRLWLTWLTRVLKLKEGGVSMSIYKRYLFTLLAGLATIVLVGCGQEKPAERAGEKADQAVERSEEKIEQPGDKVKEDAK